MRLALALLGAVALLLTFAPVAQADHDECRISLADPTSPNWTEECEELPLEDIPEDGHATTVDARASVEDLIALVGDETDQDASTACEQAPGACEAGIGIEATILVPPSFEDGEAKLLDSSIAVDHPGGERLEVTVPPS